MATGSACRGRRTNASTSRLAGDRGDGAAVRDSGRASGRCDRRRTNGPHSTAVSLVRGVVRVLLSCGRRVGLCCLRIWGCRDPAAEPLAVDCGLAFQLTNILRDLGEDYAAGRIVLAVGRSGAVRLFGSRSRRRHDRGIPQFDGVRIGAGLGLLSAGGSVSNYLSPSGRKVLTIMREIYGGLLTEIEHQCFDVFTRRPVCRPGVRCGSPPACCAARIRFNSTSPVVDVCDGPGTADFDSGGSGKRDIHHRDRASSDNTLRGSLPRPAAGRSRPSVFQVSLAARVTCFEVPRRRNGAGKTAGISNQFRHSGATAIRGQYGIETAQTLLGAFRSVAVALLHNPWCLRNSRNFAHDPQNPGK